MSTAIPITPTPRRGGPKTEAGKRRSAQNAIKHGMYSAAVVLPGESQQDYDTLLQRYLHRFQPAAPDQEYLVRTLVNAEWRINRLMHIQTTRLAERIERQKDEGRDPTTQAYSFEVHQAEIFVTAEKHEARLHRDYDRALRRLLDIEKRRAQIKNQPNELGTAPSRPPAAGPETSETTNVSTSAAVRPAPSAPLPAATVPFAQSWENRNTSPLGSAQAAGRGSHRRSNSADLAAPRESVVRELLWSAQAAGRGSHRGCNSADLAAPRESVVREFLRSARICSTASPCTERGNTI